ncbi:MAG: S8 family serine peptidase [Bacteroidetes bacterium]|nr:S8 family serine peptidase [Bacteroidota bacterium]
MKKIFLLAVALMFALSNFSQTVYRHQVDGQIYIKFNKSALAAVDKENPNNIPINKLSSDVRTILNKYGAFKAIKPFYQANDDEILPYILLVKFSQIKSVKALIAELGKARGIEYAEMVSLNTTCQTPNDPGYPSQAQLPQINAIGAWSVFAGTSTITCAIVDNAIMRSHVDLSPNIWVNPGEIPANGIDDEGNGYIDDVNGYDVADNDNNTIPTNTLMSHGTHCSGIAGARTNNSIGIASIGNNIKIIPVKCQYDTGSTTAISNGYGGIIYAAKTKARVISCSWGGASSASSAEQAVINYAWNKGCIIICAAGNDNNSTLHYPAAYNNVFSVASVSSSDIRSSFSCYGTWVDIASPGENILSTVPSAGSGAYTNMSGTSMATPLVAGLAALMLSKTPYMTQNDVLNCIKTTAVNIYSLSGNSAYTPNKLGAGRINAQAAMVCAASFSSVPAVSNFYALLRNTCPNTPVQFTDSSLYAPSVWSWTFQAGSPAISTSSAPIVQWSSPGTYSVAMQAQNGNGGNVVTKVSYITVSGPISLPFSEGFQGTTFLPLNWTAINFGNPAVYWQRQTGLGGFGTSTATAMFDNYNVDASGIRDEMWSPKFNFTGVGAARLRFDVAYEPYDLVTYTDSLEVKVSVNCGVTWTSVYLKGGATLSTVSGTTQASQFVPTAAQWRRDTLDVTSFVAGQPNVMFSFINRGHYGQALYLDNINVITVSPGFSSLSNACTGVTAITMTNTSLGALTYSWSASGASPATSTAANPTFTFNTPGMQTVVLSAMYGTLTATSSKTINVVAQPSLTVLSTASICSGNSATLSVSGASTYSWSTGSTASLISVMPISTTVYTVIGTNSGICSTTANKTITVTTTPTITAASQTICSGGTATLTANGATSYLWNTGATTSVITVNPMSNTNYTVNGSNGSCAGAAVVTSVTIGSSLGINISPSNPQVCIGNSITVNASGATSYTWNGSPGASAITIAPATPATYTIIGSNGSCSGSTIITVGVNNNPTLSVLGYTNITCNSLSNGIAQVNATGGTPAYSYSWSPSSQTTAIANGLNSGTYNCYLTDSKGCVSSISVNITQPSALSAVINSTNSSCSTCSNGIVSVNVSGGTLGYTYSWTPSGATSSIVNNLLPGNYTVTITDANGCSISNTVAVSFVTGFAANINANVDFLVFPNPSSGNITVQCGGEFNVQIYNNIGQIIYSKNNLTNETAITLDTIAKGIYFIKVSTGSIFKLKKLIIE